MWKASLKFRKLPRWVLGIAQPAPPQNPTNCQRNITWGRGRALRSSSPPPRPQTLAQQWKQLLRWPSIKLMEWRSPAKSVRGHRVLLHAQRVGLGVQPPGPLLGAAGTLLPPCRAKVPLWKTGREYPGLGTGVFHHGSGWDRPPWGRWGPSAAPGGPSGWLIGAPTWMCRP